VLEAVNRGAERRLERTKVLEGADILNATLARA
jgi:hypothetical protein